MAESVKPYLGPRWFADPVQATKDAAQRAYRFTGDRRAWLVPLAIGIALLAISLIGLVQDAKRFYFAYLTGWTFCLTTSLGALFFLFFHHLTKAGWHIVVRRLTEALLWAFPLLALLGIPIVFGMHDLYHWTHHDLYVEGGPHYDPVLAGKRAYLNQPFWIARMVAYLVIWSVLAYKLYVTSIQQDAGGTGKHQQKLRNVSAWGLPVTAVTTAFASYDILMSLDPHWYSTIFGVYMFAGSMLAMLALVTLIALVMQRRGMLQDVITREHYQDLGKYMFGFTVFWAYIGFSQYMLIWYAGIPEEIAWYQHRLQHGWGWHSAMLVLLHFIVPFFVLLPRFTKRMLPLMGFMSVWMLVMHWFDLYWMVMPVYGSEHAAFHWLDFSTWLGLTGIFVGTVMYRVKRHPLVPEGDPYLEESLHFENA